MEPRPALPRAARRIVVPCVVAAIVATGGTARAVTVTPIGSAWHAGQRVELAVTLDHSPADPFDRGKVAVDATISGPDGTVAVMGFWAQDFTASQDAGAEVLTATGEPGFRVRFRPGVAGTYVVKVTVREGGASEDASTDVTVETPSGTHPGVVARSTADPSTLVRDGAPWTPFGINVDWSGAKGTEDFVHWYGELAGAGLNWSRKWMTHFDGTALEWIAGGDSGAYCGLGCYDLKAGWRLDRILDLAESHGIAVQVVLAQHSQFETGQWSSWADNPWNSANGGPLDHSMQFFTDAGTIALFDRKLDYVAARWADSPAVLAWEIFNEVDLITGYVAATVDGWTHGRVERLRAADPYRHLVTTSYALPGLEGSGQDWAYAGFDVVQLHSYLGGYWDILPLEASWLRTFGKPVILGEWGIDSQGQGMLSDTAGAELVNATLLAAMAGFDGGAMSWWWDGWIEANGLWAVVGHAAAAVRAAGGPWTLPLRTGSGADVHVTGETDADLEARFIVVAEEPATADDGLVLWLHDPGSDAGAADGWAPRTRTGVVVSLAGTPPWRVEAGTVEAWDPWTGVPVPGATLGRDPAGVATCSVPSFARDLLIRVRGFAEAAEDVSEDPGSAAEGADPAEAIPIEDPGVADVPAPESAAADETPESAATDVAETIPAPEPAAEPLDTPAAAAESGPDDTVPLPPAPSGGCSARF